jgi:hypothetical protein
MRRDDHQIVLDAAKVRAAMRGRAPKEIENLSHKRVSGQVVRRAMSEQQVTTSLAEHLAEALGVHLGDLVKEK